MQADNDIEKIFGNNGLLANSLPFFELRPGQLKMAAAVNGIINISSDENAWSASLTESQMLAVEAETGIGKTLAYLVPAALSGKKVIVSTGTINLQDQILDKEIPFIQKHIAPDLKALCVKGRENYLCLFRAKQFILSPQMSLFEKSQEIQLLHNWMNETKTGDRSELDWLPDNSDLWRQLSSTTRACLGNTCPDWTNCFVTQLRKKAAKAQLLIVNHHLFFSDLGLRRFGHAEVLPRYESVIFDEAHHLESIATRYFGTSFSHYQLLDLAKDIEKIAQTTGQKKKDKTTQIARSLATQAELFAHIFPKELGRFPLLEIINRVENWSKHLEDLFKSLQMMIAHLDTLAPANEIWNGPAQRCLDIKISLEIITKKQDPASVYWCERRAKTVSLSATPIDIATELQDHLYDQCKSIIFTSATLTTGGTFNYFFERMGLGQETETLKLASPFDYPKRTRLYIPPTHFPEPNAPEYQETLEKQILSILEQTKGRALLLFTSIKAMKTMHTFLQSSLSYPILVQGEAPKHLLLETFQQQTESVLLAVASFWEGVNVPGDSLSCVIIDKLPFEVPSDPVIMARINKIKGEGGNPFFDFQVPRAILSLRQGIGRLMRAASDHGIIAIMDIRLYSKGYGRVFRKSLPESPIIRNIDEIQTFFRGIK